VSFDFQPVLKGELLELRPLRPEDFHELYAVASDPLIWEQHPATNRYKEEVFKEYFREALESGAALIAIDRKDGQIIGASRFHGYDQDHSKLLVDYIFQLTPEEQRRVAGAMGRTRAATKAPPNAPKQAGNARQGSAIINGGSK